MYYFFSRTSLQEAQPTTPAMLAGGRLLRIMLRICASCDSARPALFWARIYLRGSPFVDGAKEDKWIVLKAGTQNVIEQQNSKHHPILVAATSSSPPKQEIPLKSLKHYGGAANKHIIFTPILGLCYPWTCPPS
jgi:hypothetical protein